MLEIYLMRVQYTTTTKKHWENLAWTYTIEDIKPSEEIKDIFSNWDFKSLYDFCMDNPKSYAAQYFMPTKTAFLKTPFLYINYGANGKIFDKNDIKISMRRTYQKETLTLSELCNRFDAETVIKYLNQHNLTINLPLN